MLTMPQFPLEDAKTVVVPREQFIASPSEFSLAHLIALVVHEQWRARDKVLAPVIPLL